MPPGLEKDLNHIERKCAEQGLRMTGQRRIIARVLADAHDHPDVDLVYQRASAQDQTDMVKVAEARRTERRMAERLHRSEEAGRLAELMEARCWAQQIEQRSSGAKKKR